MSHEEITIYYWPGFSGRAEPIQFILECVGVPYTLSNDVVGFQKANTGFPVFACPFIVRGDLVLSQTASILAYLGNEFGFGVSQANDPYAYTVSLNLADIWAEAYGGRKGPDGGAAFLKNRLHDWLDVLEKGIEKKGGKFFFGDSPSFVDFQALNVYHILEFMYGKVAVSAVSERKRLSATLDNIRSLPGVQAFMQSGRQLPVLYPSIKA